MADTNWIIRSFKSYGSRDMTRSWVNNYELVSPAPIGPLDMIPAANAIVAAEKALHNASVNFLQVTISTWKADSKPYDPTSFVTVAQSGTGSVSITGQEMLDLNVCLMVQFTASTGRQGRRFYRGVLFESDVNANTSGTFTLVAGDTFADTGTFFGQFRSALAPVLPGGAGPAQLYLLGKGITFPTTARPVTAVHPGGVVVQKRNHKYYDRQNAFG